LTTVTSTITASPTTAGPRTWGEHREPPLVLPITPGSLWSWLGQRMAHCSCATECYCHTHPPAPTSSPPLRDKACAQGTGFWCPLQLC
jgi:hypothetical protein